MLHTLLSDILTQYSRKYPYLPTLFFIFCFLTTLVYTFLCIYSPFVEVVLIVNHRLAKRNVFGLVP